MPRVNFIGENITIEAKEKELLLDIIKRAGLSIETPCNGVGFCGKCKVIVKGVLEPPTDEEKKIINIEKHERLSCSTRILGDTDVYLIKNDNELKSINKGTSIDVNLNSDFKLEKIDNKTYRIIYKSEEIDLRNNARLLGVAIDIGTTGISYYLIDIESGEIIDKASSLNPQTKHGGDVLSRITYSMENENGIEELKKLIVDEINSSIKKLWSNKDDIYHILVSANTTMLHLLLGVSPESIAIAPYKAKFLRLDKMSPEENDIFANKSAVLELIPCASSYVGGDIVSGILACGFNNLKSGLFIDIGTNGEMALAHNGELLGTSTAAGPALEGMNIECGCRASFGAIESFEIGENNKIFYKTIGNKAPIGICGSGLIDIVGELVRKNILMKSGRWNRNLDDNIRERLVEKKFYITDDIYISQKDIRQVQLAKGAIAAGVISLLNERDLSIDKIDKIYIAGSFGYHVNPKNILEIGLIPKGFNGEIEFLGNTSLEGARLTIMNRNFSEKLENLSREIDVLELSLSPEFQDIFVKELGF